MQLRLFIALFFFSNLLFSQEKDTTLNVDKKNHSIRNSILLSTIIPSAGQIYNSIQTEKGVKRKRNVYWKVPLILTSISTTGYFLIQNQSIQHSLKEEYTNRYISPSLNLNEKWKNYDSLGIISLYKEYSNKRDLSILGFGAVYLLQIIDAGIEAHFVKFDLSENLSINIRPKIYNQTNYGMTFSFNFK